MSEITLRFAKEAKMSEMIPSNVRKFLAIKFRVNSGNWNLSDVINPINLTGHSDFDGIFEFFNSEL